MIVAEFIAKYLQRIEVTHVFGFDGSMMLKIADEISYLSGIDFYQGFHEQASSFAADAYARITGRLGVLLVTSGPGAINALAGCSDAFMDSVPLCIITGQDRLEHISSNPGVRLNGFQDLDIVNIAKPITKYAVQIQNASDIAYELEKAVYIATEGRKGPVLLDVPMDIQFDEVPENIKHFVIPECDASVDMHKLNRILDVIYHAERPVILSGGGINIAGAVSELEDFVRMTGIPVVTTLNGHDTCNVSIGSSGLYGRPEANLAVYNSDVLLCFGTRLGLQQVGRFKKEYTKAKIIHIDIDEKEFNRVLTPYISLCCDIKLFLQEIVKKFNIKYVKKYDLWIKQIYDWSCMYKNDLYVNADNADPVKLVQYIGACCNDSAIFTNDVGQNTMWVCQGLFPKGRQRLLTSSGYAAMGFSLPAAIGAAMAKPNEQIVAFSGDGGFHMNMQELQFVQLHNLNIKFVVFNNNTLGMMREVQRIYYKDNYVGSNSKEFVCANLSKVADLYNLEYIRITKECEFDKVRSVLGSPKAAIIDVSMSEETYLRNRNDFKKEYPSEFM